MHLLAPSPAFAYVATGRAQEAITLLEQVSAEPATRMMMCCRALGLEALAEAYLVTGNADTARRVAIEAMHVSSAIAMYRDMGMTHWLEQLESDWAATS